MENGMLFDVVNAVDMLNERIIELQKRRKALLNGVNEYGIAVTSSSSAVLRSSLKKDLNLCHFTIELLQRLLDLNQEEFYISKDSLKGFELLSEPAQRGKARYEMESKI